MARSESNRARIKALNDEMRANGPLAAGVDRWVLTPGIVGLGRDSVARIIERVRSFDAFDAGNDPHGEHDFGSFEIAGENVFWKIDYYFTTLDGGSPDPSDQSVTVRILTIMLALEY